MFKHNYIIGEVYNKSNFKGLYDSMSKIFNKEDFNIIIDRRLSDIAFRYNDTNDSDFNLDLVENYCRPVELYSLKDSEITMATMYGGLTYYKKSNTNIVKSLIFDQSCLFISFRNEEDILIAKTIGLEQYV